MKRVVEASLFVGPCQHDTYSPCCKRCNSHENSNQHIWSYMDKQVYRSPQFKTFKTKSTRSKKCLTSYDNPWKRTSSQILSLLEISTPEFYDIKILPGTTISFQTAILYWEGQEMVHFTINCTVTGFTAWMLHIFLVPPWTWPTWLHRKIKLVVIRFILCIHIFENFHSAAQCAAAFECPASCAQWDMVGPPVWQTGHSRRQVLWISGWADDVGITLQIQPKNY